MKFKMKKIFFLIILLSIIGCSEQEAETRSITLQQQWYMNSGFAGELWAEEYTVKQYNVDFKVIPGGSDITSTQVVVSGEADFGVAGADQVMLANESGADLVVVGVINYKTLAAFIAKQSKHILSPADFKGKKIGTMEGTPVDFAYRVLMKVNGIKMNEVEEVPTNWTYMGFMNGDYDVYPAFINDEPVTLSREKIHITTIKPHNYGVHFIGTVYFCKRSLIENHPEKVQIFVNLMIDGWKSAIAEPAKAIDVLIRADGSLDADKELMSFKVGLDYYEGEHGKILYASKQTWNNMAEQLIDSNLIKSFDYDKTVDNSYVNWYHLNDKK
jgi:NitT/TauT family transport system substrate-binding protein